MKKNLFSVIVGAMLLVFPMTAFPQSDIVALNEGFEETAGQLPDGWTQEFVKGGQSWTIESGGTFPTGAYSGNKRIVLRNETEMTKGFVTRLITKPFDVSALNEPILCFAHAQVQWAKDFDVLKVYYRTDQTKEWTLLRQAEYTDNYIPRWRMDTVELVATVGSKTYQLAFEGTDRLGRGIVLDNIMVRAKPTCDQPAGLFATNLTANTVTINFSAGFDAIEHKIIIATKELSIEELESGESEHIVINRTAESESETFTALTQGVTYYTYVKSLCGGDGSPWSTVFSFVTPDRMSLPYCESFDFPAQEQNNQRLEKWTYGNSENRYTPFINAKSYKIDLSKYSKTSTTALVFANADNVGMAIPAAQRAYTVTPEIGVEDISLVQVSFTGTFYKDIPGATRKLIVGVMDEVDNFETFFPVDTVELTKYQEYEEFIVPFTKCKMADKNGKFIALVSDFETENVFYLDDFCVELIGDCPKAYGITIHMPAATEINVAWQNATGTGDVVLSKFQIDPDLYSGEDIIRKENVATTSPVAISSLEPSTIYYLYARNRKDAETGKWSEPVRFMTSREISSLPETFDFEGDALYNPKTVLAAKLPDYLLTIDNMPDVVSKTRSNWFDGSDYLAQKSASELELTATEECYSYVIFPEMKGLSDYRVSFWYAPYRKSGMGTRFTVGVMSDAMDAATFSPIETLTTKSTWQKANIDLSTVTGKFLAFRIDHPKNANGAHFDLILGKKAVFAYIDLYRRCGL